MINNRRRECKTCRRKVLWGFHGEERHFLWFKWWVYWCDNCYNDYFIDKIKQYPDLVEKWTEIHGREL